MEKVVVRWPNGEKLYFELPDDDIKYNEVREKAERDGVKLEIENLVMDAISYFIAYVISDDDGEFLFKNAVYTTDKPIRSLDDINAIQNELEQNHTWGKVKIINWKKFE